MGRSPHGAATGLALLPAARSWDVWLGCSRQFKEKFVAFLRARSNADLPFQSGQDALNRSQPEPMPGSTLLVQTREWNEYPPAFLFRKRLAIVPDPEANV